MNVELLLLPFWESVGGGLEVDCEGLPLGFPIFESLSEGNYIGSKVHVKQEQILNQLCLFRKVNG